MENPGSNWSDLLASALVTHTPLPITATQGLSSAFLDANVSELRIILAQGSHHELAIYPIISNGAINLEYMDPIGFLPLDESQSLAGNAMRHCCTVSPLWPIPHAPGASQEELNVWVDWEEMKQLGCHWALAAPMACMSPNCCERLLGAVLVAGKGSENSSSTSFGQVLGPTINPDWLKEWSCELAQAIAHTSVSVMESSLEVLQLLYPPKVVEALVFNAIATSEGGHFEDVQRLAELLEAVAIARDAEDNANVAATGQPNPPEDTILASSGTEESSLPTTNTGINTVNARNLPLHLYPTTASAASATGATTASELARAFSPVQHSPFATLAASRLFSSTPPPPASGAPTATTATTGNTSERTSIDSYEDHGIASGRTSSRRLSSPNHMAAAVLRQASLQSRPSLLNSVEDLALVSPANSEVEGYEDLLYDDMNARLSKRPSYQIDRAHSYESYESTDVGGGGRSASPRVSVEAGVAHLRGGGEGGGEEEITVEEEQYSPRVPVMLPEALDATKEIRAGDVDGGRYDHGSSGATLLHPAHRTFYEHQYTYSQHNHPLHHHHHQQHYQEQHPQPLSTISEGGSRSLSSQLNSLPSNYTSPPLNTPLNSSAPSSPASSLNWEQEWDLAFTDARVEQNFKNHLVPKLIVVETFVGGVLLALAAVFVTLYPAFSLNQLYMRRARVDGELLSNALFPLILLFTLPLFAVVGAREAYTRHRLLLLPALRLLAALISGTWLFTLGFASLQALPLGLISLSSPLRLRFHIPLQLLCMWAALPPSIPSFLVAFVAPTAVIFAVEQRLRRKFKLDSLAAAAATTVGGSSSGNVAAPAVPESGVPSAAEIGSK